MLNYDRRETKVNYGEMLNERKIVRKNMMEYIGV
jgi:hypothetical protein